MKWLFFILLTLVLVGKAEELNHRQFQKKLTHVRASEGLTDAGARCWTTVWSEKLTISQLSDDPSVPGEIQIYFQYANIEETKKNQSLSFSITPKPKLGKLLFYTYKKGRGYIEFNSKKLHLKFEAQGERENDTFQVRLEAQLANIPSVISCNMKVINLIAGLSGTRSFDVFL